MWNFVLSMLLNRFFTSGSKYGTYCNSLVEVAVGPIASLVKTNQPIEFQLA
jgi:hypothetical protein